jgi:hypothetical protein
MFTYIKGELVTRVRSLTQEVQTDVQEVSREHVKAVRLALDTLRNENAAQEAEKDPAFRERMRKHVVDAQGQLQEIGRLSGV